MHWRQSLSDLRDGALVGGAVGLGLVALRVGPLGELHPTEQLQALSVAYAVYSVLGALATFALGLLLEVLPRTIRDRVAWRAAAAPAAALACEIAELASMRTLRGGLIIAIVLVATVAFGGAAADRFPALRKRGLWAGATSSGLALACIAIATDAAGDHLIPIREVARLLPLLFLPVALAFAGSGRWLRTGMTAAALVGAAALLLPGRPDADAPQRTNLVIISVDTLRRDHVGVYGDPGARTPAIDRFARDAVVFDDAITPIPLTHPAHTSLLTGREPGTHAVTLNRPEDPSPDTTNLAEILAGDGYRTAAFVSSRVLGRRLSDLHRHFDYFDDGLERHRAIPESLSGMGAIGPPLGGLGWPRYRIGEHTVSAAIDWLDAHDRGAFMLWVHLYDPHGPYRPPSGTTAEAGDGATNGGISQYELSDLQKLDAMQDRDTIEELRRLYRNEVSYADAQVGRLLDRLEAGGVLDRSVVVVTSDHGENLMDHASFFDHGEDVYETNIRVPLIMRLPGGSHGGRRIGFPVSLIDLAPTVLEALGQPVPAPMDGISLMPAVRGDAPPARERSVVSAMFRGEIPGAKRTLSVRGRRYKYIWSSAYMHGMVRHPEAEELYDLADDPGERINLIHDRPAVAERLRGSAERLRARWNDLRGEAEGPTVDDETRHMLESLGYTE